MKTFVTVFPYTENIHLLKDVGAIPFTFCEHLGYESTLVTIKNGEYPYNEQYTKGLRLEFIEGDMQKCLHDQWYEYRLIKRYLAKHAKEIDVLNLYHFTIPHVLLMAYYKFLNRKGIAYLKLDADFRCFPYPEHVYATLRKNPIKKLIKHWLLNKIDVISAESGEICRRASASLNCDIVYVPNGFMDSFADSENAKNNAFLTVGRLGAYQKNAESILRAFTQIYRKCDWNLVLVGPPEGDFLSEMQKLFDLHEGLEDRVIYTGAVSDKTELSRIYGKAKVFLLPSRWESFGIVVVEAQSAGCYLIVSDQVVPYSEFTDNGRLGTVIPAEDDAALAEAMLHATQIEYDQQAARDYAYEHFTWKKICEKLNCVFMEIRKESSKSE